MRKYMMITKAILLVTFSFCTTHIAFAQEEDVKWYESEKEALEIAKEENKQVLLLWGSNACGECARAKKMLSNDSSLRKLINGKFILWYCDFNKSEEGDKYSLRYDFTAPPLICVIDPDEPTSKSAYITGKTFVNELRAFLRKFESNK